MCLYLYDGERRQKGNQGAGVPNTIINRLLDTPQLEDNDDTEEKEKKRAKREKKAKPKAIPKKKGWLLE